MAWHGTEWLGKARRGMVWQAWRGVSRRGLERQGLVRHGRRGSAEVKGGIHMVYEYKVPYAKVSAQEAGEELARIECEHGGLTPELVVDASREESAPLHPVFEWDDKKAAERYRIVQAGSLIRNVTVKIEEVPRMEPVRAFVNIAPVGKRKGVFVSIKNAMTDEDGRETVVARAMEELERVKEKYKDLQELAGIFAEIDRLAMEKGA